jgi:hypothetical protein
MTGVGTCTSGVNLVAFIDLFIYMIQPFRLQMMPRIHSALQVRIITPDFEVGAACNYIGPHGVESTELASVLRLVYGSALISPRHNYMTTIYFVTDPC